MILMLLRHAKPGYGYPLAKEGYRQAQFIAEQLGKGKVAADTPIVILSSPASRAAATAKVIAQVLSVPIMIKEALGPDSPMKDLRTLVQELARNTDPILAVSHKDNFENLILEMIGKDDDLQHGELIGLNVESEAGCLNVREFCRVCPVED